MKVFNHHLYEYSKGLRRMVLHTTDIQNQQLIENKLTASGIAYILTHPSVNKINVFFGDAQCIDVLRSFPSLDLSSLSDEEDFILGVLLGYDLRIQCERYLKRRILTPQV